MSIKELIINEIEKRKLNETKVKKYIVEKKLSALPISIHKKGEIIKIFSKDKEDITGNLEKEFGYIRTLSDSDFIIDGGILTDSSVIVIWDITYLDESKTSLPLEERKELLEKLRFNDHVKKSEFKLVSGNNVEPAIDWASKLPESNGIIIKPAGLPYLFGSRSWVKTI